MDFGGRTVVQAWAFFAAATGGILAGCVSSHQCMNPARENAILRAGSLAVGYFSARDKECTAFTGLAAGMGYFVAMKHTLH